MKMRILMVISFLSVSGFAWAEGGCPSGMIPYQGTDITSCGPIPDRYYGDSGSAQKPNEPSVRWAKTWGAITIDGVLGVMGTSTGKMSEREAKKAAMTDCYAKGGGAGCKKTRMTYRNQCAAIASGAESNNVSRADSIEKATALSMKECNASDTNCRIYYSACSEPIRIQ